jgi:hypothetical protein
MRKEQLDLENAVVWIPDSKTSNGVAEVPLTGPFLFPSDEKPDVPQKSFSRSRQFGGSRYGAQVFGTF